MVRPRFNYGLIIAFVGTLTYPLLVYFGYSVVSPVFFLVLGLGLVGLRILALRKNTNAKIWTIAFIFVAIGLCAVWLVNSHLAVQAYPVLMSLSVACVFGFSLLYPPTIIERIARIKEPNLPPEGVVYTRKVTIVWLIFLILNASIVKPPIIGPV